MLQGSAPRPFAAGTVRRITRSISVVSQSSACTATMSMMTPGTALLVIRCQSFSLQPERPWPRIPPSGSERPSLEAFSLVFERRKGQGPQVLRKASVLPVTFPCGGGSDSHAGWDRGVGGGDSSVRSSVSRVPHNVRGCGGMTCGAGGGTGRDGIGDTGGGMSGKRGGAGLASRYLPACPGTPRFDGVPGAVIRRVLLFEAWKYVLRAVSGPKCQRPVIIPVHRHSRTANRNRNTRNPSREKAPPSP